MEVYVAPGSFNCSRLTSLIFKLVTQQKHNTFFKIIIVIINNGSICLIVDSHRLFSHLSLYVPAGQ